MNELPEALWLADRLDLYATGDDHQRDMEEAAAELRRLHELHELYQDKTKRMQTRIAALEQAGRQALEAMEFLYGWTPDTDPVVDDAITALRQALGDKQ